MLGLLISTMSACSKPESIQGSTSGNLNNAGLFVQQGDTIYYSNVMGDYHLMKMKADGTGVTDLSEDTAVYINLSGDWIYYLGTNEFFIYKIKTDGSSKTKLGTTHVSYMGGMVVQDDMIYFVNADDDDKLYSMKTDGTEPKKLSDTKILKHTVDGEWIYYTTYLVDEDTYDSSYTIGKIKTDGTGETELVKDGGFNLVLHEGWLYYSSSEHEHRLYRIKTNGKENTKLSNYMISSVNIAGDKLVYSTQDDHRLKVSGLDGSDVKNLIEEKAGVVLVVGDWIYFSNTSLSGRLYKVKFDGTELQKAYTYNLVEPNPAGTAVVPGLGRANGQFTRFAGAEDWIYYISGENYNEFTKIKTDSTEKSMITKMQGSYLNLIGDWLYYVDSMHAYSIARIKTDGTQFGIILDRPCSELIVRDEWMYFIDNENQHIYKIKIDGTGLTELSKEPSMMMNLSDDFVLYVKAPVEQWIPSYYGIFKVGIDDAAKSRVSEVPIDFMIVDGEYVYYSKTTDMGIPEIRKVKVDGTGDKRLVAEYGSLLGVKDGWVYYQDTLNNGGLKRIRTDGSKTQTLLSPGGFSELQFLGDKLVVINYDDGKYTLMNLDGTNQHEFIP
jgi:hypothetical protein